MSDRAQRVPPSGGGARAGMMSYRRLHTERVPSKNATVTNKRICIGGGTQPTKLVGFHAFAIAGSKPRKGGME
ncbi:MAG: hypothetical protein LW870_12545 [Pirellula sp.]|nr:hypothetical protein [Pirellula sp.]